MTLPNPSSGNTCHRPAQSNGDLPGASSNLAPKASCRQVSHFPSDPLGPDLPGPVDELPRVGFGTSYSGTDEGGADRGQVRNEPTMVHVFYPSIGKEVCSFVGTLLYVFREIIGQHTTRADSCRMGERGGISSWEFKCARLRHRIW